MGELRGLRSLESLMMEDAAATVAIYGVFALYCASLISFVWMQLALLVYVIRVFNLRHEKAHLPVKRQSRRMLILSNAIQIYHTPYQESFDQKRRKHLIHHQAHVTAAMNGAAGSSARRFERYENAHEILEGSFARALLSAAFYHEVMFVFDLLREKKISLMRMGEMAFSLALIVATISVAGAAHFAVFFLAYRLASLVAWFTFSYLLHMEFMFEHELGPALSDAVKRRIEWVLGSGSVTAIFYHKFHHRRPNQFHVFSKRIRHEAPAALSTVKNIA